MLNEVLQIMGLMDKNDLTGQILHQLHICTDGSGDLRCQDEYGYELILVYWPTINEMLPKIKEYHAEGLLKEKENAPRTNNQAN